MQVLLIIGAMKCGTTSLFEWLAHHPQICPSRVKEPEYFSFPKGIEELPQFEPSRPQVEDFEELFDADPTKHQVLMEASTGYAKYPEKQQVPQRIQREMTELGYRPKFIYLVRDPFRRIESQFNHMHGLGHARTNADLCAENYVGISRYSFQIAQYVDLFGKESILVLDLGELKRNPKAVVARCYHFLGLSCPAWHRWFSLGAFNSKVFIRHNSGSDYGPNGGSEGSAHEVSRGGRRSLTPQERKVISRKLKPDMLKLEREFGIDVARWGFNSGGP